MKFRLDPLSPNGISLVNEDTTIITGSSSSSGSATAGIPQYDTDPVSPNPEDAWMLKTSGGGAGGGAIVAIMGGGFMASTPNTGGSTTYQLSYRTLENTTIRVTLA